MIKNLEIKNYKSIKAISVKPKRVNVFIGEHNSGKSNILEALSWFSNDSLSDPVFQSVFRYKNMSNFFFDFDGTQTISVKTDLFCFEIRYQKNSHGATLNNFEGIMYKPNDSIKGEDQWKAIGNERVNFELSIQLNKVSTRSGNFNTPFRTYLFTRPTAFELNYTPFLAPPFGRNIPSLVLSNKDLKQFVSDFFRSKGYRLTIKPTENEIEMAKDVNEELYSFPYVLISETMQRYVFFMLAIKSNKDSILILDEPESNMFPFFVKEFSEAIADDNKNQYFIATHNPYMLNSLLEKTGKKDLAVFITRMKDYKTEVVQCSEEQIEELISSGSGALFNLDNIIAG